MYYTLIFCGLLAGTAFSNWLERTKNLKVKIVAIFLLVISTIPTTLGTLMHYLPSRPPAKLSNEELEALSYLANQPNGIVVTDPFSVQKSKLAEAFPPRSLYRYESTAYVSAFSGQKVFFEDEVNLEITGYNWKERRSMVEDFFEYPDDQFLVDNGITYIYLVKEEGKQSKFSQFSTIFENNEIAILK